MDFDIEDIGQNPNPQTYEDKIYVDNEYNMGEVVRSDFQVALDLFGDNYIDMNPERRVNCLEVIPRSVDDFIVYKKSIIDIVNGVCADDKVQCINLLISCLTNKYKSRNFTDLIEALKNTNKID